MLDVIGYWLYVIRQRLNGGSMRERRDRREKRERIPSLETQLSFVFPVSCELVTSSAVRRLSSEVRAPTSGFKPHAL
jgi:hypothetical protein